MTLTARAMEAHDVPSCVALLNHIIAIGGTTAYENPYSEPDFADRYLGGASVSNVVEVGSRLVGFQAAFSSDPGVYSIGSFTDRVSPVRSAGRALFAKTLEDCRQIGGEAILAKITSDNHGGLAFYSKLGFRHHEVIPRALTRKDGTVVDRIIKIYPLT